MIGRRSLEGASVSRGTRLVLGACLVALLISLGTVLGAKVFGVDVPAAIAGALAAAGTAAFAVRMHRAR
ncbi:MAG: hypothetical protein HY721_23290 [Planctomycetes bacterium]|nr:hypothetical protein [Planctomycetota bacterium]